MSATYQTLNAAYQLVRSLANKDSNTLTDATLLPIANKYYYLLVRELIGLNEEIYANISTTDLVANQAEYVLPIDDTATTYGGGAIKILRAEITYDNANWYISRSINPSGQFNPVVYSATNGPSITTINQDYSSTSPQYTFLDRSIFLYPIPTASVTAGLKLFFIERPNELTSSSSIPDLPKDWLAILQEGMLYDVFRKFGRTADARDALGNWQIGISRMKELEQGLNQEQKFELRPIYKNYR